MSLIFGIAAVAVLWWLMNSFARANTAAVAKAVRVSGGLMALAVAVLLGLRGRVDMAFMLGGFGVWLLGWSGGMLPGASRRSRRTSGTTSRVRSEMIEMMLDHDTGEMEGIVLIGTFAGRRLGSLDESSLMDVLAACRARDPDGARLVEAYLDRRFSGWRRTDTGRSGAHSAPSGGMTREEAYQVLGLEPGASPDEIRQAHRSLMKKLHPDQGGSTYLATRVNEAKDVLIGRRR